MSIFFAAPIEQFPKDLAFVTTPTASSPNASFPASNLLTYDPTQVFKSTSHNDQLNWDFGSVREFDVVALLHSNLSYKTSWEIFGSVDGVTYESFGYTPFSAHLTSIPGSWVGEANDPRRSILNRNKGVYVSPTVRNTFRYLRINIGGDATLDPGFSIGRLFVGKKFAPVTGWQYGSSFSFADTSRKERTDRGALIMEASDTIISASVKMEFLTKAEMYDYIYEFNYWRGSGREFLACLDVEDVPRLQKNLLYCTISEGRTVTFDAFNTHSQTWILESIA